MLAQPTHAFLAGLAGGPLRDEAIWLEALTHGSTGHERDYQRLEFLGDRVLGLVIASELFRRFPRAHQGELSSRLPALAS
ncbi:MAG TPA: ribonuclease III domain-containing protein, partial [Novosphingobium sp.]|nr:ribonuclease III domain-containing protein [Novosphingobium sp.]